MAVWDNNNYNDIGNKIKLWLFEKRFFFQI